MRNAQMNAHNVDFRNADRPSRAYDFTGYVWLATIINSCVVMSSYVPKPQSAILFNDGASCLSRSRF